MTALYIKLKVLLEIMQLQIFLIKLMLPSSRYSAVGGSWFLLNICAQTVRRHIVEGQNLKLIKAKIMSRRIKSKRLLAGRSAVQMCLFVSSQVSSFHISCARDRSLLGY